MMVKFRLELGRNFEVEPYQGTPELSILGLKLMLDSSSNGKHFNFPFEVNKIDLKLVRLKITPARECKHMTINHVQRITIRP